MITPPGDRNVETFRDMSASLLDTYLSRFSNRLNEAMKVLTVISKIFIPLTSSWISTE